MQKVVLIFAQRSQATHISHTETRLVQLEAFRRLSTESDNSRLLTTHFFLIFPSF